MATNGTRPRRPLSDTMINWIVIVLVGGTVFLTWPMLVNLFQARIAGAPGLPALPTAQVIAPPARPVQVTAPDVKQDIANYNATATAQWQAAQPQAAPVPNTDNTGDAAPIVVEEKPAERLPAGENVPTAEPVVLSQGDNQTGSKPVIVAPQETHQCKHGQVWVEDKGCRNP